MNIGEEFLCWITFKYQADAWERFERDAKKAGDAVDKTQHKTSNFMRVLQNTATTMIGFHSVVGMFKMLTTGFINATKQAREFEYALADIKKVRPDLDTKQIRKELFEISQVAVGKDITKDLAPAYKLAAQTFHDKDMIAGSLKLAEKMSIAYDTSASEAIDSLAVLYNNFLSNTTMSSKEKLDWLQDKGVKIAYSHHTHGRAQVKDILFALKRSAGVLATTNTTPEYAISLITQLLNTGSTAERSGLFFRRLYTRLVKGADPSTGQRITGMSEAFKKIGLDRQIFKNTMLQSGDEAFRVFFKALVDYHKKTGDAYSVMVPLVGQYPMEEAMKLLKAFEENEKLYAELQRRKPMANGKYLPSDYIELAYKTIMDTTEKTMQKAQTMKQQFQIKFGDQQSVITRGYYEAVAGLYKGLGDAIDEIQNEYTEEQKKEIIRDIQQTAEWLGNFFGGIARALYQVPNVIKTFIKTIRHPFESTDEFEKDFYLTHYNDYMLMKNGLKNKEGMLIQNMERIERKFKDKKNGENFFNTDNFKSLEEQFNHELNVYKRTPTNLTRFADTTYESPYRKFDNLGYVNNTTTNSNSNKNINVAINQNNNFNGADQQSASVASQEILNILYSQLKSG